jgi:hypothetical protein
MQLRTWNRKSFIGHLLKTYGPTIFQWRRKSKYYFRLMFAYGSSGFMPLLFGLIPHPYAPCVAPTPRPPVLYYSTPMWTNFFIAASASAALAGLVIVAISVNIARILEFPHLPARSAATVGRLILILVSSMAALIPQSNHPLGAELAVFPHWLLGTWRFGPTA